MQTGSEEGTQQEPKHNGVHVRVRVRVRVRGGVGPASPLRLAQILLQLEVLAVEILELAPRDADLGVAVLGAVGFLCIARGERAGLRENTMELESLSPDTVIHLELHGGH